MIAWRSEFSLCSFYFLLLILYAQFMNYCVHVCSCVLGVFSCSFQFGAFLFLLLRRLPVFWGAKKPLLYDPCAHPSTPRPSVSPAMLCVLLCILMHSTPNPCPQGPSVPPQAPFPCPNMPPCITAPIRTHKHPPCHVWPSPTRYADMPCCCAFYYVLICVAWCSCVRVWCVCLRG